MGYLGVDVFSVCVLSLFFFFRHGLMVVLMRVSYITLSFSSSHAYGGADASFFLFFLLFYHVFKVVLMLLFPIFSLLFYHVFKVVLMLLFSVFSLLF